jgi:lysophospholipase L1-like esterase
MVKLLVLLLVILASTLYLRKEAPMPPVVSNDRILAFGDSLTYGFGTREPERESYPARLETLSGQPVINAGVNGETTEEGLGRIDPLLERYRPGLTILCLGGNDFLRRIPKTETENNLRALIEKIRAGGSALLLVAVPEFGLLGPHPHPLYAKLADQLEVPLLEGTLSEILRDPALKSDPIHPNASGYQKMAEVIYEKLQEEGLLFGSDGGVGGGVGGSGNGGGF